MKDIIFTVSIKFYTGIVIYSMNIMNSRQAPDGIEYVLVNGQISYMDKQHTGIKAGKVLKHNSDFK